MGNVNYQSIFLMFPYSLYLHHSLLFIELVKLKYSWLDVGHKYESLDHERLEIKTINFNQRRFCAVILNISLWNLFV